MLKYWYLLIDMLRVEVAGPHIRLVYASGGKEVEAIGTRFDVPSLLGLFVAQMAREGIGVDEICKALREAVEKIGG
ncbi:hypothetical protein Pogu_1084 [Pyrobaculum oguniense TE7]|uniref:Uncharacterized protein n=1 Tax=Pyrobaculum oguniense (strain DSM 13380 / JCM 10595 / TE7) TaxID=698757 RepID=H6Q8M9_PYROT|nr:hypothetical protein Pogu_1084 [Pyrobaculum oguniense TE7]